MENSKPNQWQNVEKALENTAQSNYKIAIIECEKVLRSFLTKSFLPGKNYEDKIEYSLSIIDNPEKLEFSRKIYKKIIEDSYLELSPEDAKTIIATYKDAVFSLEKKFRGIEWKDKKQLKIKFYWDIFSSVVQKAIIAIVGLFVLILFLTETEDGRSFAATAASFVHYIFFKVFLTSIVVVLFIVTIIAIISLYLKAKKK